MEICEKARDIVRDANRSRNEAVGKLLLLCESPIEQILLATLHDYWHAEVHTNPKRLQCLLSANYPSHHGIFTVICEPQRTVKTLEQAYRVDFFVYLTRFRHSATEPECWPEMAKLIVEVDGHDFHDRTKEQASYDRRRDRELNLLGYRVVRFTGSDIFNQPYECAEDIDFHIDDLASMVLHDYTERGKLQELIYGY